MAQWQIVSDNQLTLSVTWDTELCKLLGLVLVEIKSVLIIDKQTFQLKYLYLYMYKPTEICYQYPFHNV